MRPRISAGNYHVWLASGFAVVLSSSLVLGCARTALSVGDSGGSGGVAGDGGAGGTGGNGGGPPETCGNCKLDPDEECDDCNSSDNDACVSCAQAFCGDGHVYVGVEECEKFYVSAEGPAEVPLCRADCHIPRCGDGVLDFNEQCDDYNQDFSDACPNCQHARCGDASVWIGIEACDDGNGQQTDACLNDCIEARCGDGIVWRGVEQCDDGNTTNDDSCSNDCARAGCGDGIRTAEEECDDGNDNDDDGCNSRCASNWREVASAGVGDLTLFENRLLSSWVPGGLRRQQSALRNESLFGMFARDGAGIWAQLDEELVLEPLLRDAVTTLQAERAYLAITAFPNTCELWRYAPDGDVGWSIVEKMPAPPTSTGNAAGRCSVAAAANQLVWGFPQTSVEMAAHVYVYQVDDRGQLRLQQTLSPEAETSEHFGETLAVTATRILVGTHGFENIVSVYEIDSGGTWVARTSIQGPTLGFGAALAAQGDRVVVGSGSESNSSGDVWVLQHVDSSWAFLELRPDQSLSGDLWFGAAVALDGDRVLVGAPNANAGAGAAFLFEYQADGVWRQVLEVLGSESTAGSGFASHVSLSGNLAAVSGSVAEGRIYELQTP